MRGDTGRIWIGEVELAHSLLATGVTRPPHRDDPSGRLLVRLHGHVLGFVSVPLRTEGADATAAIDAAVRSQLGAPLRDHLAADGMEMPDRLPTDGLAGHEGCAGRRSGTRSELISVVICTRDRPATLARCIKGLQQLEHPNFEVVVVDNAPRNDETHDCFIRMAGDDPRFRYVTEPAPGLSRARNRGLRECTAKIVAFTDDDVQVDRWWLEGIALGFERDARAGCVTGLAPPAELDHPSQRYFDRRYSWASHMEGRVFDLENERDPSPLYPYSAGLFGTGANFAADRRLLEEIGGFDEALGAGSPAGGGEDLDIFVRVLRSGRALVYEPSAIVWHVHRADLRDLRRQLFYYGVGLTAFLSKHLADRQTAGEIIKRLPEGARRTSRMWSPSAIGGQAPASFVVAEALGMVAGPFAYARGRKRLRRSLPAA